MDKFENHYATALSDLIDQSTEQAIQVGAPSAKVSSPTRKDDAPKLSISHGCAIFWAHVPILESKLAKQKVPNRRVSLKRSD